MAWCGVLWCGGWLGVLGGVRWCGLAVVCWVLGASLFCIGVCAVVAHTSFSLGGGCAVLCLPLLPLVYRICIRICIRSLYRLSFRLSYASLIY